MAALLTSTDVCSYINPAGSAKGYTTSSLATAAWSQIVDYATTYIVGHLTENTRKLMRAAEGLYLTRHAQQGQATFTIPAVLRNVTSARVWVNYRGVWRDRDSATEQEAGCSTSVSSIVLDDPLNEGDVAIAEVFHDFASPPALLKVWAVTVAVQELMLRHPTFTLDSNVRNTFATRFDVLREDLAKLAKGQVRIEEWDALDLIRQNETAYGGSDNQFIPWGSL